MEASLTPRSHGLADLLNEQPIMIVVPTNLQLADRTDHETRTTHPFDRKERREQTAEQIKFNSYPKQNEVRKGLTL